MATEIELLNAPQSKRFWSIEDHSTYALRQAIKNIMQVLIGGNTSMKRNLLLPTTGLKRASTGAAEAILYAPTEDYAAPVYACLRALTSQPRNRVPRLVSNLMKSGSYSLRCRVSFFCLSGDDHCCYIRAGLIPPQRSPTQNELQRN